ncbi:prion-inhibition and propagation domain-containing protein [Trichoderma camerunense]
MSELFGIVSGTIQIPTAFSACVEVFDYVQLSRRFGKDFQTNQLRLTLLKLRLSRWGAALDIYNDPQLENSLATKDDLETAKDTLLQILLLFEDSKTISDKYRLKAGKNETVEGQHPNTDLMEDTAITSVNNKMNALATKRRKGTSVLKLATWSMHHNKAVSRLVEDISGLIESLEQLFPPQSTIQSHLVEREVSEAQDEREKAALATSAQGIDQVLFAAAGQSVVHQYRNISIEASEVGTILNGNTFSYDYSGATHTGRAHMYDGISIKGTKLRVHNGDQHGSNDFFNLN